MNANYNLKAAHDKRVIAIEKKEIKKLTIFRPTSFIFADEEKEQFCDEKSEIKNAEQKALEVGFLSTHTIREQDLLKKEFQQKEYQDPEVSSRFIYVPLPKSSFPKLEWVF